MFILVWLSNSTLFFSVFTDPATLPTFEQDMRASRVIRANYSLLLQHLDANKLLPKLMDRSVISDATKIEVESYQYSWCQNAVIIDALLYTAHQLKGLLTIFDTLQATIGKEHIAQHVLRGTIQCSVNFRLLSMKITK